LGKNYFKIITSFLDLQGWNSPRKPPIGNGHFPAPMHPLPAPHQPMHPVPAAPIPIKAGVAVNSPSYLVQVSILQHSVSAEKFTDNSLSLIM
jgi:hypothetical protein